MAEAHTLTSARLRLRWWSWGDPAGSLLLLVHGGRDHGRSWADVATRFADRWHVVAPDLRGHGESAWADGGGYALEDFVYDLYRLADALGIRPGAPATLVGHSLGGNIALRWAGLYPDRVRRLAVIEGLGAAPARQAEQDAVPLADRLRGQIDARTRRETRGLPVYPDLDAAVARMAAAHPGFAPALARRLTEQGVVAVDGGVRFAHDPLLLAWPVVELTPAQKAELWAAIACPVLLCYGCDSWASDPSRDGRMAPFRDARLAMFNGAGHWLHHDRVDAFCAELTGFIA